LNVATRSSPTFAGTAKLVTSTASICVDVMSVPSESLTVTETV
jgi:hypothetical protein